MESDGSDSAISPAHSVGGKDSVAAHNRTRAEVIIATGAARPGQAPSHTGLAKVEC